MYQHIFAAFDGIHEAHLAVEETVALAYAFNGHVRAVWAIGSLAMPESRGVYSVNKLREEAHRIASASLVELQRQFDADGIPTETGVLMLGATDDDIGNMLKHEVECWQADTIVVGS